MNGIVSNPSDLAKLVGPDHTAVVTMELQRAVVGDLAALPDLRDAVVSTGLLDRAGAVCRAARVAGARVVHCTVEFRPDRQGSAVNCRMLAASNKLNDDRLDVGHPGTELVPELDLQPSDVIVPRHHGLTPFTSTGLDQNLRNMGVSTVVAVGSSLNVGVLGLVLSAVDLGFQVVVPDDAVLGVPIEYGDAVMSNTIALLATVVNSDDLVGLWQ